MLFLARKTNSKMIKDATGVARIILETGDRNASRILESAVSMPITEPMMTAARYPMSIRRIDSAILLQNADVTASEQILPRTLKGEGTIRSLPTAICIISHMTIHAAAMHSIFNILNSLVFAIWSFYYIMRMHRRNSFRLTTPYQLHIFPISRKNPRCCQPSLFFLNF